jgi:phage shock protein C
MKKKLYRSRDDAVFAGVLGGFGEYFDVDSALLRVIWLFVTVFSGVLPGLVVYIFSIFIIPKHPHGTDRA